MKISRMLAAASGAAVLLGSTIAVFAQGHGVQRPIYFNQPYYTFSPRVSLGAGLWAGDPFESPYPFYDPFFYYLNTSSFPHYPDGYLSDSAPSYATSWSSFVQPDQTNLGGMSFEITPLTAEIYVDNMRVGTVGQFTPTTQPLGLQAGYHHVDIEDTGYQTMSFDVEIVAGNVIPFRGVMAR